MGTSVLKILYLEADPKVRAIYVMKLEAEFAAEVYTVESPQEAIECFDNEKDFVFLLADFDLAVGGQGAYVHIKSSPRSIPVLLLGNNTIGNYAELSNFDQDNEFNKRFNTPIDSEEFTRHVTKLVRGSIYDQALMGRPEREYAPVRISNFYFFNTLPVDVFIRLSEEKYVRLLKQDEMYPSDVIKKYEAKGVSSLYVRDYEYKNLAEVSIKTLLRIYDKKSLGEDQKQAVQLMAIENIHQKIQDMGLTPETVALTKNTLTASVATVKRSPSIWQLLKKMKSSGNYIYDHSLQLSYLCTAVCRQTDWNSDSTLYKLSLASLMHDMTLTNPDLARIQDISDRRLKDFSPSDVDLFKRHPNEAAELVKADKGLPRDVHFIIQQHHERPEGDGFPRGLSKLRIAPLSCIFIICHDFIDFMDKEGEGLDAEARYRIVDEMEKRYMVGNFKKPFIGLKSLFGRGDDLGTVTIKD